MNIYIGNLSYRVRESDLQQVLEEYGIVDSVKLIVDRDTRRSKGFAFAEMPNVDEAQKAIEELNQSEYEGRLKNKYYDVAKTVLHESNRTCSRLFLTTFFLCSQGGSAGEFNP